MDKFKFFIFSVIALAVVGILGYWAVSSLESGSTHANKEKQEELEERNSELEEEIEDLKNELAFYKQREEEPAEMETSQPPASNASYKYQTLISEFEDLIADKIIMKVGSKGTRVGTVQNFLNLYYNTAKKIDNDYGKTTKTDVANFQKSAGLSQTGETGVATYEKMVEWLKQQG